MAVVTVMPRDHEWTVADLAGLPDDGLQYELFDGVLLVSPAPTPLHQRVVAALYRLLHSDCPPGLEVYFAPLDFQPDDRRSVQPDVLVVRRGDVRPRQLVGVPVLTVEVLSDSTRSKDRIVKHEVYRAAGVPSFWLFDPGDPAAGSPPSVVAYELRGDAYVEVASAAGADEIRLARPYPVTIRPEQIVAG